MTECCNHDCNQGRDCPYRTEAAKVAKIGRKDYSRQDLQPTVWRRHVEALAEWFCYAIIGWLCAGLILAALVIN